MSTQTNTWKDVIDRKTIVPKSFYIRAEKSNWYPEGILKLYRNTKTQMGDFTYQAVRIRNPEELSTVKLALDWLGGQLNWKDLPSVLEEFKKQVIPESGVSRETLRLVNEYPDAANEILKGFDVLYHGHINVEDFPTVRKVIRTAMMILANQTKQMTESKIELFKQLERETSPEGIKRLTRLLDEYDLPQLTSVANIIMDRLEKIKYLKATIQNESAYEFKGKDSVHNQLVRALWMIDDSYWLLTSNQPLTTFLQKDYESATSEERRRPDLICANDPERLVIIELKRPSYRIVQDDINKLHNCLITVDRYRTPVFSKKLGYLIGKEISPTDQRYIDDISGLHFIPYLRLVEDCETRYREYLKALENQENE